MHFVKGFMPGEYLAIRYETGKVYGLAASVSVMEGVCSISFIQYDWDTAF
jgi:hypothetical protein